MKPPKKKSAMRKLPISSTSDTASSFCQISTRNTQHELKPVRPSKNQKQLLKSNLQNITLTKNILVFSLVTIHFFFNRAPPYGVSSASFSFNLNETNHILTERQVREERSKYDIVFNDDGELLNINSNNNHLDHLSKLTNTLNKTQPYPVSNFSFSQLDEFGNSLRSTEPTLDFGLEITSSNEPTISDKSDVDKKRYSFVGKIILTSLACAASLITVCGNLLVMLSFFLDRQIRNPTNYFILSLSVSDFLIGLISIPFLTVYLMLERWPFGKIICNLWLSLDYTVCLTSIYTVLFITIDRFCSVKMPAKYRNWRTPNKIIIMVMLTWVIPFLIFFPSIFGWSFLYTNISLDYSINCDVGWFDQKIFIFTLVFCYFWTTLIVIIVLYIFIYQVARNLERKSREKQRKLSSLVGASATNTGALVGVVAFPAQVTSAVNRLNKQQQMQQQQPQPQKLQTLQSSEQQKQQQQNVRGPSSHFQKAKKQMETQQISQVQMDTTTPEENDEQEDDYNTADSQSRLSKGSIKKRKKEELEYAKRAAGKPGGTVVFSTSSPTVNSTVNNKSGKMLIFSANPTSNQQNHHHHHHQSTAQTLKNILKSGTSNNHHFTSHNNANSGVSTSKNIAQKCLIDKPSMIANNHSFASSTVSNNDDFSSSYESHSDYDLHKKQQQQQKHKHHGSKSPQQASHQTKAGIHNSGNTIANNHITIGHNNNNNNKNTTKSSIVASAVQQKSPKPVHQTKDDQTNPQILKPRPESLAVMSNDQFAEKCAKQSSTNLNSSSTQIMTQSQSNIINAIQSDKQNLITLDTNTKPDDNNNNNNNDNSNTKETNEENGLKTKDSQIPFIDDEFEDLSYMLTRRHIICDKENKIPIKEEKILIKSPLKSSFFRKFSSPIKNISSRRSSQKSQNELNFSSIAANPTVNGFIKSPVPHVSPDERVKLANDDQEAGEKVNLLESSDLGKTEDLPAAQKLIVNLTVNPGANNSSPAAAELQQKITPSSTFTAVTVSNSPTLHNLKSITITTNGSSTSDKQHSSSAEQQQNPKLLYKDSIKPQPVEGFKTNNTTGSQTVARQLGPRPLAKRKTKHENRARKALRTITFILGAFIFCFAPWHVVSVFNSFCATCFDYDLYHHFFYSCYFLCYLNSPINPFMYALANQQFKKVFLRILKGDFRRV